ncbi:MAG: carboxypeptidase regulatory-like domain-containing protein, partial [Acidobacteriaceae bacterium]|nr:carboxypeptidase regulatory-like domain-containing protein [Acidobacteriaceae bacterium]
ASVGGIPVSWLVQYGLNPNDPIVGDEDPDHDGLTNLQEYQRHTNPVNPDTDGDGLLDGDEVNKYGTDPLNPDTDGDKIPDGIEVQTGTDPKNPNSFDLKKAAASSAVTPASFTLSVVGNSTTSVQLTWKVALIDGKTTLDLTADPRTQYSSSNLNVCSFGERQGLIFAGSPGSCVITISLNTLTATVAGTVTKFTPTQVSPPLPIPGATAVDVAGNFVYVTAGVNGLVVVDVNDRTKPFIRGKLAISGNANAIRIASGYAYIADASGFLRVANVQDPNAPTLVSSLPIAGSPTFLAVHGAMAAVAATTGGVSLVNITDPTNPALIAQFSTPGNAVGVDFDPQTGLAAVAIGTMGLQLADISNPAAPKLRGRLPGGNVLRVLLRLPAAILVDPDADAHRSVAAVDVSNPDAPVLTSSMDPGTGGRPLDIAAFGNIAMTADQSFGKAVPILSISDPLQPTLLENWNYTDPGYSSSVAMDPSFAYLIFTTGSALRIVKYQDISDPFGIPPSVSITSPVQGANVIQGERINITVNATNDVAVASVTFTVDGQAISTTSSTPYQASYTVPPSALMLTLGATALDYGNNMGVAQNVSVTVIPDPLTTATGKVTDANGSPVSGATVSLAGLSSSPTATTSSDGSFSLTGVPTVLGNIQVLAKFVNSSGATLAGFSAEVAPVRGGTTDAGTITIRPIPLITKLSRKSMLASSSSTLQVTGTTLTGATWQFQPEGAVPTTIQVVSTSQDGTSTTLSLTAPDGAAGTFALVASNVAGSSGSTVNLINRFTVVDPNSTADTDSDGFQDVIEAVYGTDPLDPNSFPVIRAATETESVVFSVLNAPVTGAGIQETESVVFSVLNAPFRNSGITEADFEFLVHNSQITQQTAASRQTRSPSSSDAQGSQTAVPQVVDPLLDSDGDGLPDWYELAIGTDPQKADTDGDGLNDFEEVFVYHTNPLDPDTDGDGFEDGEELLFGSDPLNSGSTPLNMRKRVLAKNHEIRNKPTIQGGTNVKARSSKPRHTKVAGLGSISSSFVDSRSTEH